jgi:tetratricopeptide (TPR) repeat protein
LKSNYLILFSIIVFQLFVNVYANKEDSLLNLIENSSNIDQKIDLYNKLSNQFLRSDTTKSLKYAQNAILLAEKNNNVRGQIASTESLARYYTEQGNYNAAKTYLINILDKYSDSEHDKEIAAVCISLANIYDILSEFDLALTYYLKAEKSFEKTDNKRGMGLAQMGIANVYSTTKFYKEAIKYYKRSYENLIKIDEKYASWSINNMAIAMMEISQNDSALFFFEKSLEIKLRFEDYYGASYTYTDMGTLFEKLDKNNLALESYEKALEIKKTLEGINPETIGSTYNKIGNLYIKLGKYSEAISNLEKGIEYSIKSSSLQYLSEAYKNISNAYYNLGSFKEAFHYLEQYSLTNDSLVKLLNSETLTELKMVYETVQKDKDIELLNNSVALQQKTMKLQELEVEESNRKNQLITIYLVSALIVIVLALGLGWVLYKANINKKKTNEVLAKTNQEINHQKHIIEEKHKEITDSINYAERIQRSFLASTEMLNANLGVTSNVRPLADVSRSDPGYFVFFKPKDVVSGDFYWASSVKTSEANGQNNEVNSFCICCADSTGHGVPGAIMSILNISSLEKAIETETEPHHILGKTRELIIDRLKKDGSLEGGKDGMDCSLLVLNQDKTELRFASANNPVFIVTTKNGVAELVEAKPDKMPVGKHDKDQTPFTLQTVSLQKGDLIYTLTDGMPDQFGGEKGKKYMIKNLKNFFLSIAHLPMKEQHKKLEEEFTSWKGSNEQIDDVCIIGVRV